MEPLFRICKGGDGGGGGGGGGGHLFSVSCATWYPVDTGVFFTGSFDRTLAGWDANTQQRVVTFEFPEMVYAASMAPHAASHCLVAVGSGDPQVRLCDPLSGNVTHALTGHREGVMATEWMRGSEWVLATGGGEGDVRLWDSRLTLVLVCG
jgi:DNA excision repair protein ERCC-8